MGCLYIINGKIKKQLNIFEDSAVIKQENFNDVNISYDLVTQVHYKPAKLTAGYIRFVLKGDLRTKMDVQLVSADVNSVLFNKDQTETAEVIVEFFKQKNKRIK